MKEKMMKMLAKKKDLHPAAKKAKMDVVHELRQLASDAMNDKMDGLKKVSVMSDSQEGLKHGLDKAKEVLSGGEEDQMLKDSEAPYSDDKHAMEEHLGEDQSNEFGDERHGEPAYADGGPVLDPSEAQKAQGSMRKAFGYNEGGEIEESPDFGEYSDVEPSDDNDMDEEESPDKGEYGAVDQESPAEHEDNEFHGLDVDELNVKLAKLMKLKKDMESRKP